ncbi:MAG: ribonuclease PH [Proteobacteria bacterium]|nr:ribonuclease PH [Pseudomonadota bacterium]
MPRIDKRNSDDLRPVFLGPGFAKFAHGSCFVKFGDTHVLCTATVEEKVPHFLKNTKTGWITAEYGMLPCSTQDRMDREASKGKQSGRTQEIQRLIGRSLRAIVDLKALGERQVKIDCDVLQADGGTRTASITGAYVALYQAMQRLVNKKQISSIPFTDQVAAISCGIYQKEALLDLNYVEDSSAEVDANFVLTASGKIIEVQACAEKDPFDQQQLAAMLMFAQKGTSQLFELQKKALNL